MQSTFWSPWRTFPNLLLCKSRRLPAWTQRRLGSENNIWDICLFCLEVISPCYWWKQLEHRGTLSGPAKHQTCSPHWNVVSSYHQQNLSAASPAASTATTLSIAAAPFPSSLRTLHEKCRPPLFSASLPCCGNSPCGTLDHWSGSEDKNLHIRQVHIWQGHIRQVHIRQVHIRQVHIR